jgi:hypothetical protein
VTAHVSHADEADGWFGMFICRHNDPFSCIFPMADAFLFSAFYSIISFVGTTGVVATIISWFIAGSPIEVK